MILLPWKVGDVDKHMKGLSMSEKEKWCKRANGFLAACLAGKSEPLKKVSGDTKKARCEASAIVIANSAFEQTQARESGLFWFKFGYENLTESIREINMDKQEVILQLIQGDNSLFLKPEDKEYHDGWSKNGYYYSQEMIQKLLPFVEVSRKMYMDHKDLFPFGRSLNDWTATIEGKIGLSPDSDKEVGIWEKNAACLVKAKIVPNHNHWLLEVMRDAPSQVGISIDAYAYTEDGVKHGHEGRVVTQWMKLNSPDFVTEASAKGKFIDFSEAIQYPEGIEEIDRVLQSMGYFDEKVTNQVFMTNTEEDKLRRQAENMTIEEIKALSAEQLIASGNLAISEAIKNKEKEVQDEYKIKIEETERAKVETETRLKGTETKLQETETKLKETVEKLDKQEIDLAQYRAAEKTSKKLAFIEETSKSINLPSEFVDEKLIEVLKKMEDEQIKEVLNGVLKASQTGKSAVDDNPPRGKGNENKDEGKISDEDVIRAVKKLKRRL